MTTANIITLPIPNPFPEGRTQVYVVASDPITIIDTGVATDRAFDALVHGLAGHGLTLAHIKRVVLTHKHIDHIGNAWRIREHSGAEIFIHESELDAVRDVDPSGERFAELVRERFAFWVVPEESRPTDSSSLRWKIEPADATPLDDGLRLPFADGELEVVHTPGHSYGSVCLRFGSSLFTGDHVLPDISPNIGGGDMRRRGLLQKYFDSLRKVAELAADEWAARPGHGQPFTHLRDRCEVLISHHNQRLEQIVRILQRHAPQTTYEIARKLFGPMQDFHVVLGCAEAGSHLECLVDRGRAIEEAGSYRLF